MPDTYDQVPYPSYCVPLSHPDRMATMATLAGLSPPPPQRARVLEVGCGEGSNLLSMAYGLPEATFVGFDANAAAIARAQESASALDLGNIRFEVARIEEFDAGPGSYDYLIAHGVFSWIPEPARRALLALCAHVLDGDGIGFVSYNALPGARVPHTVHELLHIALRDVVDPHERLAGARRILTVLSGDNKQHTMIGAEAAHMLGQSDELLVHDALAEVNDPYSFTQFMELAHAAGLQYIGEANFTEMQAGWLPEDIREALLPDDELLREQVLDQLKVRRFRQTLLCGPDAVPQREMPLERVMELSIASTAVESTPDPEMPDRRAFAVETAGRLVTDDAVVIRAFQAAIEAWPETVPVAGLVAADAPVEEVRGLCEALLRCFGGGLVALHIDLPPMSATVGPKPRASRIARHQALSRLRVASLRHTTVMLSGEPERRLLVALDGTRTPDELVGALGADPAAVAESLERFRIAGLLEDR